MFALCVEASHQRGMGHLFRALTLADALEKRGREVLFLVNEAPEAAGVLRQRGGRFEAVPVHDVQSDWEASVLARHTVKVWLNDRLSTDARHVERLTRRGVRVATFDDHGSGAAAADLHIRALPAQGTPSGKVVLSGLDYLVLDPEIAVHRRVRTDRRRTIVSMGGSDTYGLTIEVVRALAAGGSSATVVLGPGFRHESELTSLLDERLTVLRNVPSLARELARHDVAVTAGGMTLFEACAAGLPCIAVAAEPWEERSIDLLAKAGACVSAGYRAEFDRSQLLRPLPLERMSRAGMDALDLRGAERVVEALLAL